MLSLLLYLAEKSKGSEKEEIKRAYGYLKKLPLETEKILKLLQEIENEKGIRIAVEV